MCIRLVPLENGAFGPCRDCNQCKADKINDWRGRCKAEMATSRHTLFATLTYGMDDKYGGAENNLKAKMLDYDDIRLWLQLLRKWTKRGPEGEVIPLVSKEADAIRYFACGEYGSKKGRAHWHVLLFCQGRMPPNIRLTEPGGEPIRYIHTHQKGGLIWPYGWSQFRLADEGGIGYATKYITNDDILNGEEKRVGLSIKPPLGDAYFRREAVRYVDEGISPQSCKYRFPNEFRRDGSPREYYLGGSAIYNFLHAYAEEYYRRHGHQNWPYSALMADYLEEKDARSQRGVWNWRDEPDWVEARKLERRGIWPGEIGVRVRKAKAEVVEKSAIQQPFPPLSAYEID